MLLRASCVLFPLQPSSWGLVFKILELHLPLVLTEIFFPNTGEGTHNGKGRQK